MEVKSEKELLKPNIVRNIEFEISSKNHLESEEKDDDKDKIAADKLMTSANKSNSRPNKILMSAVENNSEFLKGFIGQNQLYGGHDDSEADNSGYGGSKLNNFVGKELAKKRLKALGNFKKIQMESKNLITTQKQQKLCILNSSEKKDKKPLTAHEKAKVTKDEIELMKKRSDRAIPCLYYDAALIHHIRAESPKNPEVNSNIKVSSLEAIKGYQNDMEDQEKKVKIDSKRHSEHNFRSPRTNSVNNYSGYGGFSKNSRFYSNKNLVTRNTMSFLQDKFKRESRKPYKGSRNENYIEDNKTETLKKFQMMYTKTKPVISFAFNPNVEIDSSKLRGIPTSNEINTLDELKEKNEKSKKERKPSSFPLSDLKIDEEKLETENSTLQETKKIENSKHKYYKPEEITSEKRSVPGDMSFEENFDIFPLSKDESITVKMTKNIIEDQVQKEIKLKLHNKVQTTINAEDKSPDTDDYMCNWEDEDAIHLLDSGVSKNSSRSINDVIESGTDNVEIKDGLSTPIFINPSPPADLMMKEKQVTCNALYSPGVSINSSVLHQTVNDEPFLCNEQKENSEVKSVRTSPLFGLQHIYEQFIQSVNGAGIDLNEDLGPMPEYISNESISKVPKPEEALDQVPSDFFLPKLNRSQSSSSSSSTVTSSTSSTSSETPSNSNSSEISLQKKCVNLTKTEREDKNIELLRLNITNEIKRKSWDGKEKENEFVNIESGKQKEDESVIISSEDKQRIEALQKRKKMLKDLQDQCADMDEEDKECYLGVKKLIEAELSLLIRKINPLVLKTLFQHSLEDDDYIKKEIPESKEKVKGDKPMGMTHQNFEEVSIETPKPENKDLGMIFDTNRETIKLKIPSKNSFTASASIKFRKLSQSDGEDQDFTEKLMKSSSKGKINSSNVDEKGSSKVKSESQSRRRSYSHSRSRSPKRSRYRSRSSSYGSDRYRRSSNDKRGRQSYRRRRDYSPSPQRSRRSSHSSYRRNSKKNYARRRFPSPRRRDRRWSRSRSPCFRPPSPPLPPPPDSDSSRDCRSPCNSPVPNVEQNQYYAQNENYYYYLMSATNEDDSLNLPYPHSFNTYPQYNQYANLQAGSTSSENYPANFGNEYMNSNLFSSCSRIPVIGENSSVEYFYGSNLEYDPNLYLNESINSIEDNSIGMPNVIINKTEKLGTFAVQKGNVLEIVPASGIPKQETTISADSKKSSTENVKISAKKNVKSTNKKDKIKMKSAESKMKIRTKPWEDEIARRQVMSAVLKLNRDDDGTLRGILRNKINSDAPSKDKKKVLFADGIPPGKTSSGSDYEDDHVITIKTKKKIKKKIKKKRIENKENIKISVVPIETKVDPILEKAPPPPPPPGSPAPHLIQPVSCRPPSPEQFLFYHYDKVLNLMFFSYNPTAIPPRLTNPNFKIFVNPMDFHNNSRTNMNFANKPVRSYQTNDSVNLEQRKTVPLLGHCINQMQTHGPMGNINSNIQRFQLPPQFTQQQASFSVARYPHTSPAIRQQIPPLAIHQQKPSALAHQEISSQFPKQLSGAGYTDPTLAHFSASRSIPPRVMRPNFPISAPNMSRSNLLPLTPGPGPRLRPILGPGGGPGPMPVPGSNSGIHQGQMYRMTHPQVPPYNFPPAPAGRETYHRMPQHSQQPLLHQSLPHQPPSYPPLAVPDQCNASRESYPHNFAGKAIPSIVGNVTTAPYQQSFSGPPFSQSHPTFSPLIPSRSRHFAPLNTSNCQSPLPIQHGLDQNPKAQTSPIESSNFGQQRSSFRSKSLQSSRTGSYQFTRFENPAAKGSEGQITNSLVYPPMKSPDSKESKKKEPPASSSNQKNLKKVKLNK